MVLSVLQIVPGSLAMNLAAPGDKSPRNAPRAQGGWTPVKPTHLFGTTSGAIGCIAVLTEGQFKFLDGLQRVLAAEVVEEVACLQHKDWRAFANHAKVTPSRNFVDGDLVEKLLLLSDDKIQGIFLL